MMRFLKQYLSKFPKIAKEHAAGLVKYIEQDHSESNLWRKRTSQDGIIDFRMTAEDIHNLVLALSKPYPGADVKHGCEQYKIWKSAMCTEKCSKNIEPGRVLDINKEVVLIKTAGGSGIYLWSKELSDQLSTGDYI